MHRPAYLGPRGTKAGDPAGLAAQQATSPLTPRPARQVGMMYACRKGQQKTVAGASIFADEVVAEGLAQIKDPHWRRTLELSLQMSKQAMCDKVGDLVRPALNTP